MNILVFSQYYYPEKTGPTEVCEELVKKGNKVKVITGLPNYPEGIVSKEYKLFKNRKQKINGVDIERTFEIGRRKSTLFLALNYISFCISASFRALFISKDYDIVYCYQLSPITLAIPAVIYSKLKKKPLVLYCLDLWPESLKVLNIKEKSIIFKTFDHISKRVYNKCDKILVSSKSFKEYLVNKHGINENLIGYQPQQSKDFNPKNIKKEKKEDKVRLLFAGNIGQAQNVEIIVEAVNLIEDKTNIVIDIAGSGSNLENIKELVKENKLEDYFVFHGQVDKEKMAELYNKADACLLTLKAEGFVGKTLPLKVQSYMSSGKPIIAAIEGDAKDAIIDAKCGICVNANDSKELANTICDFIKNKSNYDYMGLNARKYYEENYTLEAFVNNLDIKFKEMLGDKKDV